MSALYKANFARPLPRNVLDLVRAKWADVVWEEVTGGDPLPPFKAFKLSRPRDPHFPGLAVYRRATRRIVEAGNFLLNSAPEFAVEVADEGDDEEELLTRLETRVEVVDSIIRTAVMKEPGLLLRDFPEGSQAVVTVEIPEHVYGQDVPQGKKHIRVAALTLIAELMEP
jgi:hypothetical protein